MKKKYQILFVAFMAFASVSFAQTGNYAVDKLMLLGEYAVMLPPPAIEQRMPIGRMGIGYSNPSFELKGSPESGYVLTTPLIQINEPDGSNNGWFTWFLQPIEINNIEITPNGNSYQFSSTVVGQPFFIPPFIPSLDWPPARLELGEGQMSDVQLTVSAVQGIITDNLLTCTIDIHATAMFMPYSGGILIPVTFDLHMEFTGTALASGLNGVDSDNDANPVGYFNIDGIRLEKEPANGIYIIKYDNGTAKKILK